MTQLNKEHAATVLLARPGNLTVAQLIFRGQQQMVAVMIDPAFIGFVMDHEIVDAGGDRMTAINHVDLHIHTVFPHGSRVVPVAARLFLKHIGRTDDIFVLPPVRKSGNGMMHDRQADAGFEQ